ncbi:PfkB family carbohydrate kinase [Nocardia pseudobrasiliensis]|nr:PfkB family carbohydrate kinase [Nocardia pseudobrasiliensis]
MLARTRHVIGGGYSLVASPGPRFSRLARDEVRTLVTGADLLFTNERERDSLIDRADWTSATMLSKVKCWVTTLGANGAIIESATAPARRIAAVPTEAPARRGGAGTGFRAGFLAALRCGADAATAAHLGTAVATAVLETPEAQGFRPDLPTLTSRVEAAHGPAASRRVRALLTTNRRGRTTTARGRDSRRGRDDLFAEDIAVARVPGELLAHGEQGPSHADRALAGDVHGVVECEARRDLS